MIILLSIICLRAQETPVSQRSASSARRGYCMDTDVYFVFQLKRIFQIFFSANESTYPATYIGEYNLNFTQFVELFACYAPHVYNLGIQRMSGLASGHPNSSR